MLVVGQILIFVPYFPLFFVVNAKINDEVLIQGGDGECIYTPKDGDNVVFELEAANADWPFIMSDYHFKIFTVLFTKANSISSTPFRITCFSNDIWDTF